MKDLSLIYLFCWIFVHMSCAQSSPKTQKAKLDYNPDQIAIIPFKPEYSFDTQFKNAKPANLIQKDLEQIEVILQETIETYNTSDPYRGVIQLEPYKRQYMAFTNKDGEKEVWINCFCRTHSHAWKSELMFVADGGKCYFNLKINVTKGKSYGLIVNGEA